MKRRVVLLVFGAVLLSSLAAFNQDRDSSETLKKFTASLRSGGMILSIVHLNDVTVDILLKKSQPQAWKTRARLNTLFFVQGLAESDTNFDPSFKAVQTKKEYKGTISTNIHKLEPGTVSKGERITGIVSFDKELDVHKPFKIYVNNVDSTEFRMDKKALQMLTPKTEQR